jgi:hypothetical protein
VRRLRAYAAVLAVVLVTTSAAGVVAESERRDGRLPTADVLGGEQATGVDGATGTAAGSDPVRVGVIGTAFDPERGTVAPRVAASRRIGGPALPFARGPAGHDTAVAEVVAEQSPAAALYLAGVGPRPTAERYGGAVEWLLERDVDVIVDAGSYFPRTTASHDQFETAAERAAVDGAVFVTSAGNYAQRHWRGRAADSGWLAFDGESRRNTLRDTDGGRTVEGRLTLRLYWGEESGTPQTAARQTETSVDYDLYLYRRVADGRDRLVASSTRSSGTAEAIDTTVPAGEYYVQVHADRVTAGTPPLDLFAARHRLTHTTRGGGTLPPATVPGVIAVGAVDGDGGPARYAGSVGDVRAGDTVVTDAAGRVRGTSAATPVVAGTVTDMIVDGGRLSPGEVETILRETADDERRLDPDAAIARADELGDRQRGVTASVWTGGTRGDATSVGVSSTNRTSSVGAVQQVATSSVLGQSDVLKRSLVLGQSVVLEQSDVLEQSVVLGQSLVLGQSGEVTR